MAGTDATATTKSVRTRTAIIDAALTLFRERGYDATTMRAIAAQAGVSVGNAYYYFASKEQLIQGFYDQAQVDHERAARPVLDHERDLGSRIVGVSDAWFTVMAPYRPLAGKFFKNVAAAGQPPQPLQRRVPAGAGRSHRDVAGGARGLGYPDPQAGRSPTPGDAVAVLHGRGAVLGLRPHTRRRRHPSGRPPQRSPAGTGHRPHPAAGRAGTARRPHRAGGCVDAGAHVLAIKDMAGLLRAPAARTPVTALRERFDLPVHLHNPTTPRAAAGHAARGDRRRRRCRRRGHRVDGRHRPRSRRSPRRSPRPTTPSGRRFDLDAVCALEPYWEATRRVDAPFESGLDAPTGRVYTHEIPGGQLSNLRRAGRRARAGREVRADRGHVRRRQRHPRQRRQGDPPPRWSVTSRCTSSRSARTRRSSRRTPRSSTSPTR